jgi:hypothetical protein
MSKVLHASSFERYLLCPGSLDAEEGLPDTKSDEADSGMKVHNALRLFFSNTVGDLNDAAKVCALEDREEIIFKWFVNNALTVIEKHGGAIKQYPEFKFEDTGDSIVGTSDLIVRCKDGALLVFDWKTGYGKQLTADKNLQLRVYAVKTAERFGCISVLAYLFSAGNYVEDSAFSSAEYGPDEITEAKKEIYAIRDRCLCSCAKRIPGAEQCKYCKASGTERCPESLEFKKHQEMALTIRTPLTPEMAAKCSTIWDNIKTFEAAAKGFKRMVKDELARNPDGIPGLRLEPPESKREITNPEKVFEIGVNEGWFDQPSFVSKAVTIKIGELVKLVKTNLKITQKEATELVNTSLGIAGVLKFEPKEQAVERIK